MELISIIKPTIKFLVQNQLHLLAILVFIFGAVVKGILVVTKWSTKHDVLHQAISDKFDFHDYRLKINEKKSDKATETAAEAKETVNRLEYHLREKFTGGRFAEKESTSNKA